MKHLTSDVPISIDSGDMDGDGRDDLLGSWNSGVFFRGSVYGNWVMMASTADVVACGDLDGDGKDDLIGVWPSQGGTWVNFSLTGNWEFLASTARDIAVGDMNGDGIEDLVGTWDGQGVFYRDSANGAWVKMALPADCVAAGDLDSDGTEDLLGVWPSQGGIWVKFSTSDDWEMLGSAAKDIDTGVLSGGLEIAGRSNSESAAATGLHSGPEFLENYENFSDEGPLGWNFDFQKQRNLIPQGKNPGDLMRIPGPGEPGFIYVEQKNIFQRKKT